MGDVVIRDAVTGQGAKVDSNRRVHVHATTDSSQHEATAAQRGFNINTGWITLTDAANTDVLYFKNREAADFHVEGIIFGYDTEANGTATAKVRATITKSIDETSVVVTDGVVCPVVSNNYVGSGKTLVADVFIGNTADTIHTGGSVHAHFGQSDFTETRISLEMSVPNGQNICVSVDPTASTDSFPLYVALVGHITDPASD